MTYGRHLRLVCMLVAVLLLSGCTGLWRGQTPPALGVISGTVVDDNGKGITGLRIYIGSGHEASTDDDGYFEITDVPVGTYELTVQYFSAPDTGVPPYTAASLNGAEDGVITLNMDDDTPRLQMDGVDVPWEHLLNTLSVMSVPPITKTVAVQVTAKSSKPITVSIPDYRGVDALFMYHAWPPAGSQLQAGTKPDMQFSFTYSLNDSAQGYIAVIAFYEMRRGNAVYVVEQVQPVQKGTNAAVVSATPKHPIPDAALVHLQALLVSWPSNVVVAVEMPLPYVVQGSSKPIAPELELIHYDDFGIVFGLYGGHPLGFKAYSLYRGTTQEFLHSREVQRVTDPNVQFITDTPPAETTYYYWLVMEADGYDYRSEPTSSPLKVSLPRPGMYDVPLAPGARPTSIVADPTADRLYATIQSSNMVHVFSTTAPANAHHPLDKINVGARPDQIAVTADGEWLLVATPGNHSVTRVNTHTLDTERLGPLGNPGNKDLGIAVHPNSEWVYVGISEGKNNRIQLYDIATLTLLHDRALPDASVVVLGVDRSGTYLYAGDKDSRAVHVFDAADLAAVTTLPSMPLRHNALPASDGLAFIADNIIDTTHWTVADKHPFVPVALSHDEQRMYALGHHTPGENHSWFYNALYVMDRRSEQPLLRVPLNVNEPAGKGTSFALTRDETRLYYLVTSRNETRLAYVDIAERLRYDGSRQ